jgi:hypothetical protein
MKDRMLGEGLAKCYISRVAELPLESRDGAKRRRKLRCALRLCKELRPQGRVMVELLNNSRTTEP